MDYALLGNSGLHVSRLCFGTMTFGGTHGFERVATVQLEEAKRQIDLCFDAGINFFDTADMYSRGVSEEILGKAIGQGRRDKAVIATKVFFRMGEELHDVGLSRRHIVHACEASLKRLNTDYIDLYQVHNFDSLVPIEETLHALNTLVTQGKVRYIGCSNYAGWQLMKALSISQMKGFAPFISQQVYYSLLARELENELLPLSLDQKLGIMVWSPLSFGLLTGKYRGGVSHEQNTRLSKMEMPGTVDLKKLDEIVDVLDAIAQERGKSMPQVALRWLLQRPGITSVIIGARNEVQLKDNLGAIGWELTKEEMERLNKVSAVPELYPYWHQHFYAGDRNPRSF